RRAALRRGRPGSLARGPVLRRAAGPPRLPGAGARASVEAGVLSLRKPPAVPPAVHPRRGGLAHLAADLARAVADPALSAPNPHARSDVRDPRARPPPRGRA